MGTAITPEKPMRMRTSEIIFEAKKLLARMFEDTQDPAEQEFLRTAFEALDFIWSAGKIREFESFRKMSGAGAPSHIISAFDTRNTPDPHGHGPTIMRDMIVGARELLGRLHEQPQEAGDKVLLQTALETLGFIWASGKIREFEEYCEQLFIEGPSYVVAAFSTLEEAQVWLNNHLAPPAAAYVLVADAYYAVADYRDSQRRALFPHPTLEFHLERMLSEGTASVVATFKTHEAAREWFNGLSEKPGQAVIEIGGERYLVAYHKNIDHVAFHPFSILRNRKKSGDEKLY